MLFVSVVNGFDDQGVFEWVWKSRTATRSSGRFFSTSVRLDGLPSCAFGTLRIQKITFRYASSCSATWNRPTPTFRHEIPGQIGCFKGKWEEASPVYS